jgi:deazaflavin-dependent oxidoreductase (nitroreductase family)
VVAATQEYDSVVMTTGPELDLPPSGTRGVEIPGPVRLLIKAMSWTGDLMFRFGMKVGGQPLLRLSTVGARTGKRRHVVLGWFHDEERPGSRLIVASNGGAAQHPGWAYNMAKNPDQVAVDVGDGEYPVEVEVLEGDDRERAWNRVVGRSRGYGRYTEKTDREIPVFRLS